MIRSFDAYGFLSDDVNDVREFRECAFEESCKLFDDQNMTAHIFLRQLAIEKDDAKQVYGSTLFVRFLMHAQGAFILLQSGLKTPASALCRCALEVLFFLGALSRDKNYQDGKHFANAINAKYWAERKKLLLRLRDVLSEQDQAIGHLEQKLSLCAEKVKEFGEAKLSGAEDFANAADLLPLYTHSYMLHNASIHFDPDHVLHEHLQTNEGDIRALVYEPDTVGGTLVLSDLVQMMLLALISVHTIFDLKRDEELFALDARTKQAQANLETVAREEFQ